jgi:20S proteasome alpha/beta subunit
MDLDAALRLAVQALRQAEPPGETGARREVAVLERDRARRSFRRLSEEDFASRTAEPGP